MGKITAAGRTAVFVMVSLSIGMTVLAKPAFADTVQAGRFHDGQVDNGTKATLSGDANLGGTNSLAFSFVRNQATANGNTSGLYQFGWVKTGSNSGVDQCLNGSYSGGIVERRSDPSGSYVCNLITGIGNYGDTYLFTVKHVTDGWEAIKENGTVVDGPHGGLSFNNSFSLVGSEKSNSITSMSMTFGPNGGTVWKRYEASTDNWAIVGNDAGPFGDPGWSVGAMPCPFNVSR